MVVFVNNIASLSKQRASIAIHELWFFFSFGGEGGGVLVSSLFSPALWWTQKKLSSKNEMTTIYSNKIFRFLTLWMPIKTQTIDTVKAYRHSLLSLFKLLFGHALFNFCVSWQFLIYNERQQTFLLKWVCSLHNHDINFMMTTCFRPLSGYLIYNYNDDLMCIINHYPASALLSPRWNSKSILTQQCF